MKCEKCGKEWNVSVRAFIPATGYICPHCTSKERRDKMHYYKCTACGAHLDPQEKCNCDAKKQATPDTTEKEEADE